MPKRYLLDWKACSDIPIGMKGACGVFHDNQLLIGGGCTGNSKADSRLYAYSPDVDMWKVLPPSPLKWFGMVEWKGQLVLIGGKDAGRTDDHILSNKLAVWERGKWQFSLPAMPIPRVSPTAVSHGKYLAVTGGRRGYLGCCVDTLDADSMQWHRLPSVPINTLPHTTAVCNNKIYLLHQRSGKILHTDLQTFLEQKSEDTKPDQSSLEEQSDSGESDLFDLDSSLIWKPILKPPVPPLQMASIGGHIAIFSHGTSGEGHLAVHAFFPETNSWYMIGKFPALTPTISCITSPKKQMYVAGGELISSQYSQKMFQAVMKVSTRT